MKCRIIIIIALCLVHISASMAQDKKVALGLGFSPTLNYFKADSDNLESNGNRAGFNYGLIADFHFGENYAFHTGFFINNYGGKLISKYSQDSLSFSVENDIKIQTIRLPITLKMMTKEIGYFRYYGIFGFNTDFTLKATTDSRINGGPEESDVNITSDTPVFNASLVLGIGFMYNWTGTTNFMVGISYNNGFVNMLKETDGAGDKQSAYTRQFALNLGVLF